MIKYSPKTKSHFVGCTGYPDCDVTYPLPKARYESVRRGLSDVRHAAGQGHPVQAAATRRCASTPRARPASSPRSSSASARPATAVISTVRRSPNTLKRYVRCTNYDACGTSYPLPQSGDIEPTDEVCECGTPKIIVHTRKGPWKICVNPECPMKPPAEKAAAAARGAAKGRSARASAVAPSAKKAPAKKRVTKKPAAKKAGRAAAAKKPAARGKTAGETA